MRLPVAQWGDYDFRPMVPWVAALGLCFIGLVDFFSGYLISWSIFYVFPIALATWYVSERFAAALAGAGIILWFFGDLFAGADFSTWLVPLWNSMIRLSLFGAFIILLSYIKSLTGDLEARVAARTADLERLEHELLEVGERERRRIGSDLHDGLGQHLTGASFAAQVLRRQLHRRGAAEVEQASEVISLIEGGISLSHKLAKGLQPIEMHAGGLMQALQDLVLSASNLFKVNCSFRCDAPVLMPNVATAEQLYRIAQESTSNAVKHGHAKNIVVSLDPEDEGVLLQISDDGEGFIHSTGPNEGMGLRIMAKRASIIGARFDIHSRPGHGTIVTCHVPKQNVEEHLHG